MTTAADTIVVDTDVFSYVFGKSQEAARFLPHLHGRIAALTFVTVGELLKGGYEANWGRRRLDQMEDYIRAHFVVLPPHVLLARHWAEIMANARKKGAPLGHNDAWIAASAVAAGCPLLTNNHKHFQSIDGLTLLP